MFDRWRRRPLRLQLGAQVVSFESVSGFEFALASRTEVPSTKVADLVRLEPEALEREAASIREVQREFVGVLSAALDTPGVIGSALGEMDPKLFSQDHRWREIIAALRHQERDFEEFKRVALVKYLQYLGSRQDVLQSIYSYKHAGLQHARSETDAKSAALRETVIFQLGGHPPGRPASRYARLPRGETVTARLDAAGELEVLLSRHAVAIVDGARPHLRDENGREYPLEPGRNVVGRQPECDVVVDAGLRDVSRQHVTVVLRGPGLVELTDFSSHGTFVPAQALVFPDS